MASDGRTIPTVAKSWGLGGDTFEELGDAVARSHADVTTGTFTAGWRVNTL